MLGLLLDVADEIGLGQLVVVADIADGDDGSGRDHALDGVVHDLGVVQDRLQRPDPTLHVALLVLGGVIVAVLGQISQLPGALDRLGHLDPTSGGEVGELRREPLVRGAGQLMSLRHGRAGYRHRPTPAPGHLTTRGRGPPRPHSAGVPSPA